MAQPQQFLLFDPCHFRKIAALLHIVDDEFTHIADDQYDALDAQGRQLI